MVKKKPSLLKEYFKSAFWCSPYEKKYKDYSKTKE